MFTRIVRTGLSRTVSTPAIAAQWTMWVTPSDNSRTSVASSTSLCELGRRERIAVEVVERDDLVLVHEALRERRADEARAARDQDAFAAQGHATSLVGGQQAFPAG
jgi:hypothetical protein